MGRTTGGAYSLPGAAFVSGTVIKSTDVNAKFTDLASAMSDSLSRSGNGDMLAPLRLIDGSAAIPAIAFANDIDTGFYLSSVGAFRASVLASTVQEWSNTGTSIQRPLTVTQAATFNAAVAMATTLAVTGSSTLTGAVSTQSGLAATNTNANSSAIIATGNGTGAGVSGTGGTSSGAGVSGTGGATNGAGVVGTGTGLGEGGRFTGGAGAIGVRATGTNNHGIVATGNGGGVGMVATGGTTSAGGTFANGTAATGAIRRTALAVTNGDISLDGVVAPDRTTVIKNAVTPSNICKCRATFTTDGAGGLTTGSGFNLSSIALSGGGAVITFANAFATANPTAVVSGPPGLGVGVSSVSAASVTVAGSSSFATTALTCHVVVYGEQ